MSQMTFFEAAIRVLREGMCGVNSCSFALTLWQIASMARPLRIQYPGALYHVTARGNAQASIFLEDEDRERFLGMLEDVIEDSCWLCYAYCLMVNHYEEDRGLSGYSLPDDQQDNQEVQEGGGW